MRERERVGEVLLLKSDRPSPPPHPSPSIPPSPPPSLHISSLAGDTCSHFLRWDPANHVVSRAAGRSPGHREHPGAARAGREREGGRKRKDGGKKGRGRARPLSNKKGEDGEEEEPGRQRAGVRQGDPVPHPDLPVAADQVGVRAEQVSEQQNSDFFISFLHSFIIHFEKGEEMGEDNCVRD